MNSTTILFAALVISAVAGLGLAIYWRVQVGKTYDWYKQLHTTIVQLRLTIQNLTELYTLELDKLFTALYNKKIFETREEFDMFVENIVNETVTEFNQKHDVDLFTWAEEQEQYDNYEDE